MIRNREVQVFIFILCVISLVAIGIAAFFSSVAIIIVMLTSLLLMSTCLVFTKWRYREIGKLSELLRKISAGGTSLDVRDNNEGELSILKNEIYKMTRILFEQGTGLQEDKLKLTNAISDISHQLKTPLTSMMMMADLLSDADLPVDKRMEFTHNIRIQLERMEWLVSSLLKLSKIDARTAQFKTDQVPVNKLIQKALAPMLIPMDIKEQSPSIQGDVNASFIGDLNWTAEALINILKNCVEQINQITDGKGVNIILDSVGGTITEHSFACLANFGRYIAFGNSSGKYAQIDTKNLHSSCRSVLGYSFGTTRKERPETLQETAAQVFRLLEEGKIKIKISERFHLRDAAHAHDLVESRSSTGKVLLYTEG